MIEVIKYTGDEDTFVFPYCLEDFNPDAQLIVGESQEAFLYYNIQLINCFGPGIYTLGSVVDLLPETEILAKPVFLFVDKTKQSDMRWGVSKVDFTEPEFNLLLNIGAHGKLTFTVPATKVFIINFIIPNNLLTQDKLLDFTREFFFSNIKLLLTETINSCKDIGAFTIENQLDVLSVFLKEKLTEVFINYGLQLIDFVILGIHFDENALGYKQFIEKKQEVFPTTSTSPFCIHPPFFDDIPQIKLSENPDLNEDDDSNAGAFNLVESLVKNEGIGMISSGLGIGLGFGATGVGADDIGEFCKDEFLELKELFEMGCITEEEYHTRKTEILIED